MWVTLGNERWGDVEEVSGAEAQADCDLNTARIYCGGTSLWVPCDSCVLFSTAMFSKQCMN